MHLVSMSVFTNSALGVMVLRLETCHVTVLAQVTIQVTITDSNYSIVSTQRSGCAVICFTVTGPPDIVASLLHFTCHVTVGAKPSGAVLILYHLGPLFHTKHRIQVIFPFPLLFKSQHCAPDCTLHQNLFLMSD